jgi:Domain of unknown function (DUF397)
MTPTGNQDLSRATWRKSRRSNNGGNCVEVTTTSSTVAVRDSKDPHGPALTISGQDWRAFTAQLRVGHI